MLIIFKIFKSLSYLIFGISICIMCVYGFIALVRGSDIAALKALAAGVVLVLTGIFFGNDEKCDEILRRLKHRELIKRLKREGREWEWELAVRYYHASCNSIYNQGDRDDPKWTKKTWDRHVAYCKKEFKEKFGREMNLEELKKYLPISVTEHEESCEGMHHREIEELAKKSSDLYRESSRESSKALDDLNYIYDYRKLHGSDDINGNHKRGEWENVDSSDWS